MAARFAKPIYWAACIAAVLGRYSFSQSTPLKLILIGRHQLPSQSAARSLFGFVVA
jgi:hypothetical protein